MEAVRPDGYHTGVWKAVWRGCGKGGCVMASVMCRGTTGMTCGHCISAVSGELRALDGVSDVTTVLVPGGASAVTVTSDRPLARQAVADALEKTGDYQLAGSSNRPPGGHAGATRSSFGPGVIPGPFGLKIFSRTGQAARDSAGRGRCADEHGHGREPGRRAGRCGAGRGAGDGGSSCASCAARVEEKLSNHPARQHQPCRGREALE